MEETFNDFNLDNDFNKQVNSCDDMVMVPGGEKIGFQVMEEEF